RTAQPRVQGPAQPSSCSCSLSDGALVKPADGIERRGDRSFLPSANKRCVLARERNSPVDLAQVVVVLGARRGGPHAKAAEAERGAMPRDGNAILEFLVVLRVDLAAVVDHLLHALRRSHGG